MRFRCESERPIEVTIQAWVFPKQPGDFVRTSMVFEPGVTREFEQDDPVAKVLAAHPMFTRVQVPTIWDRLTED